jgi:hypothetical protein
MDNDLDPLQLAEEEARAFYARMKIRVIEWAKRYLTVALVKVLLPSAIAVVLAVVALPTLAAVVCVAAIALLALYSINATRLLKRKDAELRWAWVANKRLHQRHLDHQIATDNVILELMGERTESRPFRFVPQELRSALAYVKRKVAEASQPPAAKPLRVAQRTRGLVSEGPAIAPIKARKSAREAEHATLTAEIESLATAGDIERAMKVEEAKRTQHERQDAAMKADKAARERVRARLRPTATESELTIAVGVAPNGEQEVAAGRRQPTPEQIAAGGAEQAA